LPFIKKLKLKHLKKEELIYYKKQTSTMSDAMPFKLDEIIKRIDEIIIAPPKKNDVVSNQLITFPKLDGKMLDFQTPFTKMTHGGFPQKGNPLYETFLQRANSISIPIQKGDELEELLTKLQKKVEENTDELVPEDMKGKIELQDFVREYENVRKNVTELSMRARLSLDIIDMKNEKYVMKTSVWKKDGKTVKEVPIQTVEDVEKEIRYNSDVQFIIRLNKLYISTKNEGTKKEPKYKMGVTFKIMAVQVIGGGATNNVNYKNNYTFNNNDDEEIEIDNKETPVINTDNLDDIDEDQDEEED
jgi:hypothetical protein